MRRLTKIYTMLLLWAVSMTSVMAQTESWTLMHQGDKHFNQGDFKSAEKYYDNALELDTTNLRARYNLADTYLAQNLADSAYIHFHRVAKDGEHKDKGLTSKAFHNMGVILQTTAGAAKEEDQKQNYLRQAITDYKQALRLNPNADDSRYNMVLCMKQLKESENNQQDQQQDKNSQNKSEQKEKSEDKKQQQQPKPDEQQPPKKEEQKSNSQTKQMLNYARQKEQQTKEKINVLPQKRQRGKNW